ncbi:MAG TPA: FeoA family protein [Xanthomonadaceae bacterium]|nr:FeoA family protein [Xanthomonadaceae bacterium]
MRLSDLPRRIAAIVCHVEDKAPDDPIARRLRELGFVPGEPVEVMAAGPLGAEPLLVQVGFTRFALRRSEAARVRVERADARVAAQAAAPVAVAEPAELESVA